MYPVEKLPHDHGDLGCDTQYMLVLVTNIIGTKSADI